MGHPKFINITPPPPPPAAPKKGSKSQSLLSFIYLLVKTYLK